MKNPRSLGGEFPPPKPFPMKKGFGFRSRKAQLGKKLTWL
jgi:hypothetical protein